MNKNEPITQLLHKVNTGQKELLSDIYARLYDEIKQIAQFQIAKLNTGQTITPTVLAHDCYIKLTQQNSINIHDSKHFLNCLSISMRQLLIDVYRTKLKSKSLENNAKQNFSQYIGEHDIDFKIIELDLLLRKIEKINDNCAQVLNYKLILAMTFPEIAKVMGLSERQVHRIWQQAKALLMALANQNEQNKE